MKEFSLNVIIDHDLNSLRDYLNNLPAGDEFIILADTNTAHYCLHILQSMSQETKISKVIKISPGEKNKNLEQLTAILEQLTKYGADKSTLLINLGGGVVTDIGGFAASIFKRGIRYIHVPTSLMGQLDASIGGKNGVDILNFKNLAGTISMPEKVFISKKFLDTLPEIEKKDGMVEALKHALIADKNYWDRIKNNPLDNIDTLLERSVEIKTSIVSGDIHEKGDRKKLNAGHTIGHAVESWKLEDDKAIMHGEAVAAGLIMESYISNHLGYLSSEEFKEIRDVLLNLVPKVKMKGYEKAGLISRMMQDKKNERKKISFSLITKIGECRINEFCERELIEKSLEYYAENC